MALFYLKEGTSASNLFAAERLSTWGRVRFLNVDARKCPAQSPTGRTGPSRSRLSGDCHNVHDRHVNHLRGVAASLVIGPSGCLSKTSWSRRFIF
jgi:hypothetical protein